MSVNRVEKGSKAKQARIPHLTRDQAWQLQEELINGYTQKEFQRKLHQTWFAAEDQVSKIKVRQQLCLEVQGPVISKYGFDASRAGVAKSVLAFRRKELEEDVEISQRNFLLGWLTDPETQTKNQWWGAATPVPEKSSAPYRGVGQFEKDLFATSRGLYRHAEMRHKRRLPVTHKGFLNEVSGRASIVVPTMGSRRSFHEQLWECFDSQTYEDKELIVVETTLGELPSPFFQRKMLEDERVVYVHLPCTAGKDLYISTKRNIALHLASGEFIVNFDDDDLYAPIYIDVMLRELKTRELKALTLSTWHNFHVDLDFLPGASGICWFLDPRGCDQEQLIKMKTAASLQSKDLVQSRVILLRKDLSNAQKLELLAEDVVYGYGFSYVHLRKPALEIPYDSNIPGIGEDFSFIMGLRKHFGGESVGLRSGEDGICIHLVHASSTSCAVGSRLVLREELESMPVAYLEVFKKKYLEDYPETNILTMMGAVGNAWAGKSK